MKPVIYCLLSMLLLYACSSSKNITGTFNIKTLEDSLAGGHVGISIYNIEDDKMLVEHNAHQYFTPASNVKLFTCYAAMKHLGDSLVGMRYYNLQNAVRLIPTGDPTFLHPDFEKQPVLSFLKEAKSDLYLGINKWTVNAFGKGWAWDDYSDSYMPERSPLPIAGNTVRIRVDSFFYEKASASQYGLKLNVSTIPRYFKNTVMDGYALPPTLAVDRTMMDSAIQKEALLKFGFKRSLNENYFATIHSNGRMARLTELPFVTNGLQTAVDILTSDYGIVALKLAPLTDNSLTSQLLHIHKIYSQPTDSLLKPMMHRSDNFYAEQSLLMVSNEKLGMMNDEAIIDTLLKTDFKSLPDKPVWVDGSGLSRYNLFTPADFVWLLTQMHKEFSFNRIKGILPTGGQGTLLRYFTADSGYIFAKTGTLSGQVALSGFLTTRKGKTLAFSVLVNNHNGSAGSIRRAVEKYLIAFRKKY